MKKITNTNILEVRVDLVTLSQAREVAQEFVTTKTAHYITTPNVEIIMLCQKNKKLRDVINRSSLNLIDSTGVAWAVQKYTGHKPERITGVDFAYELLHIANAYSKKVLIVSRSDGLDAQSSYKAVQQLQSLYPKTKLLAYSYDLAKVESKNFNSIDSFQVDIILLGLGTPLEDFWASQNVDRLKHPAVVLCCGGTVDFMAGVQKRAPERVRKLGLEWLWRLLRQPSRLKRQMVIPDFIRLVKKQAKKT